MTFYNLEERNIENIIGDVENVRESKQISSFLKFISYLKKQLLSPYAPEGGVYKNLYEDYLYVCKTNDFLPLKQNYFDRLFSGYGIKSKVFYNAKSQKATRGREIELKILNEMIDDFSKAQPSKGTAIMKINGTKYYMTVVLRPEDSTIKKLLRSTGEKNKGGESK